MTESHDVIIERVTSLERRLRRGRWIHLGYLVFAVGLVIYLIDTRVAVFRTDESTTTTHIELVDEDGNSRGSFSALLGMTTLSIHDAEDRPRAYITRWANGYVDFAMLDDVTHASIYMRIEDGSTELNMYDANGNKRIEIAVGKNGSPHLALYNENEIAVFEAP